MRLEEIQQVKRFARERLDRIVPEGPAANAQTAGGRGMGDVFEDFHNESPRWFSLGIGTTKRPDDYQLAIRIRTPKPIAGLEGRIEKELAPDVGPDDLNVQYTGEVFAISRQSAVVSANGVLKIGASISARMMRGGSLGFFARSLVTGAEGFVSANHVIGRQDRAKWGEPILHPAGAMNRPPVATFGHLVPLGGGGEKFVDCAFAELAPDADVDRRALPNGRKLKKNPAAFRESANVRKVGFSTSETFGRVTSFDQDNLKVVRYGTHVGIVSFDDQIEVETARIDRAFSAPGDSGSLVYNDELRAVGLLFANTRRGGFGNRGFSYVNRIDLVLEALKVKLST